MAARNEAKSVFAPTSYSLDSLSRFYKQKEVQQPEQITVLACRQQLLAENEYLLIQQHSQMADVDLQWSSQQQQCEEEALESQQVAETLQMLAQLRSESQQTDDQYNTHNTLQYAVEEEEEDSPGTLRNVETSQLDFEEFINAVKGYPCLWNTSLRSYKELPKRKVAWLVISEKFGKDGLKECGHTDSKWVNEMELRTTDCCKNVRGSQKEIQINKSLEMIKNHFSDYISYNNASVPSYASKASKRSLMCRISQAVSVIVSRIAVFCAVLVLGFAVYFFLKRRWTTDDEETRQMLYFVDKIIDTLRRHHEVCLNNKEIPPYLPIPHVRDMLIPLAKRKRMANIWQKAVEFLNSSDSRIRIETQRIAGEDFEVWRWIGVCTPKMKKSSKKHHISTNHAKYWQGPAFDEIEKVVRMPIVTPTPCLKIRYMHEGPDEKGDSWVTRVQDAILEKINKDGAQILHIYVDKTSKEGCVYVKCDSLNSAGKAFRSMYGNWFDGRLVIVKFVTLARYHQRFPDALGGSSPLKPSGTSESSLNWVQENDD